MQFSSHLVNEVYGKVKHNDREEHNVGTNERFERLILPISCWIDEIASVSVFKILVEYLNYSIE